MNRKIPILFFITFIIKNITTSPPTHPLPKYDIAKTLQNSIQSIYQISKDVWKILSRRESASQDITFTSEVENKKYICDLSLNFEECKFFSIHSNFINNKVVLAIREYRVKNKGWIKESNNPKQKHFTDQLMTYYIKTVYESNGSFVNASCTRINSPYYESFVDFGEAKNLTEKILQPFILNHTWNKIVECVSNLIQEFAADLSNTTRTIFTSNHPDFSSNEQQHYYLIPKIPLICFELRNITIKGLSNFHLLNISNAKTFLTLQLRNIRGEMIIDYGSEVETPMDLNLVADYFVISFNASEPGINVELKNYRVYRTIQNTTLTDEQSAMIIQQVESEMVSSLMPSLSSMEVWWTNDQISRRYNMGSLDGEMMVAVLQQSDLNTKKKALKKWIPFNDDHTTTNKL